MYKLKQFLKRLFTPVSIMLVPHSSGKTVNFKIPVIGLILSVMMFAIGLSFVFSVAVDAIEYRMMKDSLSYYKGQFVELKDTITDLKTAQKQFRKLFNVKSKEDVLEHIGDGDSGSIDVEALKRQINETIESVGGIKQYLQDQRDIYLSTPKGWPTEGRITSGFGMRMHPIKGEEEFHSGLDISTAKGSNTLATADGIVSFSGWSNGNGNLVVVEHGFGYSTFYAHNSVNIVKVGQKIKRGDIVAQVGTTGSSTGPHLHYEIWKDGRPVNPGTFISGNVWQSESRK